MTLSKFVVCDVNEEEILSAFFLWPVEGPTSLFPVHVDVLMKGMYHFVTGNFCPLQIGCSFFLL